MENENQTKKMICQTALKLFKEKSFQEVTINEICKACGITKHTFYYYFSSKDELLKKFYIIPYRMSPSDLATILNADSYVEQLWLINKSMIDFLEEMDVDILKQIFIKNLTADVGTFHVSDMHKQILSLQRDIIKKGQIAGEFLNTSDPQALAMIFRHSIMTTSLMQLIYKSDVSLTEAIRFMFESIFNVAPEYRKIPDAKWQDFTRQYANIK